MRLIDADALMRRICGAKCGCEYEECGSEGDCGFEHFILGAPTIDAVEVVQCNECKYAYINSFSYKSGIVLCRLLTNRAEGIQIATQHDDFCSYGERMEDK